MNWLKVGAVVIGGIVVFFVVNSVVHLLLGLMSTILFVAIVGGGIYGATRLAKGRRRRELRQRPEYREQRQSRYEPAPEPRIPARDVPPHPAPGTPASHHDVEDELARLKREMGSEGS